MKKLTGSFWKLELTFSQADKSHDQHEPPSLRRRHLVAPPKLFEQKRKRVLSFQPPRLPTLHGVLPTFSDPIESRTQPKGQIEGHRNSPPVIPSCSFGFTWRNHIIPEILFNEFSIQPVTQAHTRVWHVCHVTYIGHVTCNVWRLNLRICAIACDWWFCDESV